MNVSTTTLPRYCQSVTRWPYWSVSEKLLARRPGGIVGPSNGDLAIGADAEDDVPRRASRTPAIAASKPTSTTVSSRCTFGLAAMTQFSHGTCPTGSRIRVGIPLCEEIECDGPRARARAPAERRHLRPTGARRDRGGPARAFRRGGRTGARVRQHGAPDRLRADDLATDRRRADARAARVVKRRSCARRRHRVGLPRRAARAPDSGGVDDRAPSTAERPGADDARAARHSPRHPRRR